jgi:transposase
VAPFVVPGAINGTVFDTYVRELLAPAVGPGDIVVLDNLNVHKSPRAAAALAERGAWFLFLPRYSPDLNPIEMAFAKLKARLRAGAHRTVETLWQAIGSICDLYDPHECRNYFKAAGYVYE